MDLRLVSIENERRNSVTVKILLHTCDVRLSDSNMLSTIIFCPLLAHLTLFRVRVVVDCRDNKSFLTMGAFTERFWDSE